MDIGLVLQTDPPASRVVEFAARAELGGFSHVWTFDSSVLWQEPFVVYSQILAATSEIKVGPMVTNPLSREPSVTASLFATLNDMFGNRTVCGIGRGDSAMRVLGRTPSSLATLAHSIRVIRDLAEGREVDYDGTKVRIPWVRDGRLEVWMAAYGPKALKVCGEAASRSSAAASWRVSDKSRGPTSVIRPSARSRATRRGGSDRPASTSREPAGT